MEALPKTRIVVVGTGSIGMRHLRLLQARSSVAVSAIPSRSGRIDELRQQGFETAASIDEALERRPAGAIIASDTAQHVPQALRFAAHCAVLVEKPLGTTALEALPLLKAARPIHVACVLRFDAGLNWVRDRRARLGTLRLADVECLSWLPDWRPGRDYHAGYAASPEAGGVLRDLIHEIDYCQWLLGPAKRVVARLENSNTLGLAPTVDETASLTLEHTSGLTTNLRLSFAVRPPSRRLRIFGDHGALEWDGILRRARLLDAAGHELEATSWPGPAEMYERQADAWLGALGGQPSQTLSDAAQGISALEVCDAARASSREGRWVDL